MTTRNSNSRPHSSRMSSSRVTSSKMASSSTICNLGRRCENNSSAYPSIFCPCTIYPSVVNNDRGTMVLEANAINTTES